MIQIINAQGLILQPDADTVIPVEVYNPIFIESGELFQEIIYNAQAGLTDSNKQFIGYGHRIEAENNVYEQPVTVLYRGSMFFKGIFRYKIVGQKINFELKVNFGTVAKKVETAVIRDIITLDSILNLSDAAMATLMYQSCLHPDEYPFAFFPVHNSGWMEETNNTIVYPWRNNWNHTDQKFIIDKTHRGMDPRNTIESAWFKLGYALKVIFKYLGFDLQGEALSDPEFKAIYIYTRGTASNGIASSLQYFPAELKISDFLKQVGERLKLNFTYNLITGAVTMESPITALRVSSFEDITDFVEGVTELSTPEKKGYKVTMKPDETDLDQNLAKTEAADPIYAPAFTLQVGDGENDLELDISTLKQVNETDYSYPSTNQYISSAVEDPNLVWPIRLMRYYGFKTLPGGKVYPEALSYELNESDAIWYRFLNESKKIILNIKIPAARLARFTPTSKFGFKSKEGTQHIILNSKFAYNLSSSINDLISVKIEGQTIPTVYKTPYSIQPYVPDEISDEDDVRAKYKFSFEDGTLPDIVLKMEVIVAPGLNSKMHSTTANAPSDMGGIGGQAGSIIMDHYQTGESISFSYRIYGKAPKYMINYGTKYFFTKQNDYYTIPGQNTSSGRCLLIVF